MTNNKDLGQRNRSHSGDTNNSLNKFKNRVVSARKYMNIAKDNTEKIIAITEKQQNINSFVKVTIIKTILLMVMLDFHNMIRFSRYQQYFI